LGDNLPCAAIKRFVVRADEKLTAFVELESVIRRLAPFTDIGNSMIFVSSSALSFAFRDECNR
jgi:hypothetical protein